MPTTGETTEPRYDLSSPAFLADPYPTLRRMREEDPVHYHPALRSFVLTRYADIAALARDPRLSAERGARGPTVGQAVPEGTEVDLDAYNRFLGHWMNIVDPPRHTRLRGLVAKTFTVQAVERMRPTIEAEVARRLDAVRPAGAMDVIHDLAYPVPAAAIARILGIPEEDIERFKGWTDDVMALLAVRELTKESIAVGLRGVRGLDGYLRNLIAARRRRPTDDLLSALTAAEEAGAVLSEEELVSTCALLLVAGHETTTYLIGNAILALLDHPAELAKLRAQPDLIGPTVEEVLRYDGAVFRGIPKAREDLDVAGVRVPAGSTIVLMFAAGNRDPARFDDPDRFDITRRDARHLGFGQGIHFCLGAPLARLTTQIAVRAIAVDLPGLALGTAREKLAWIPSFLMHGLRALPVTFDR